MCLCASLPPPFGCPHGSRALGRGPGCRSHSAFVAATSGSNYRCGMGDRDVFKTQLESARQIWPGGGGMGETKQPSSLTPSSGVPGLMAPVLLVAAGLWDTKKKANGKMEGKEEGGKKNKDYSPPSCLLLRLSQ